jgi:pilus assembly protein Flp/PilA
LLDDTQHPIGHCAIHSGDLKMTKLLTQFVVEEDGVTAIEYGLIAALIAVVIIGAVQLVGTNLSNVFNFVAGKLTTN